MVWRNNHVNICCLDIELGHILRMYGVNVSVITQHFWTLTVSLHKVDSVSLKLFCSRFTLMFRIIALLHHQPLLSFSLQTCSWWCEHSNLSFINPQIFFSSTVECHGGLWPTNTAIYPHQTHQAGCSFYQPINFWNSLTLNSDQRDSFIFHPKGQRQETKSLLSTHVLLVWNILRFLQNHPRIDREKIYNCVSRLFCIFLVFCLSCQLFQWNFCPQLLKNTVVWNAYNQPSPPPAAIFSNNPFIEWSLLSMGHYVNWVTCEISLYPGCNNPGVPIQRSHLQFAGAIIRAALQGVEHQVAPLWMQ